MELELSHLLDALPGLVWTALPDGRAEFLNQRWCKYTGLSLDQAIGCGWQSAIHPNDLALVLEGWRSFLDSGRPGELEARLRRYDGEYRRFLCSAAPITDKSGQVVKWCGLNTDIEQRLRAEEARESHFRSIFDGLPALVTLMTPDGDVELANRHVLEFFGASLEDLKGRANGASFHPEDYPGVVAAWRRSQSTGEPYDFQARQRRADGIYRWVRVRGFPLRDRQERIVNWYCLQTDVDDARRAEAKLASEKRLLELVARGTSLPAVLEELCRQVEDLAPGCYCSILLIDPSRKRFQVGGRASLPGSYNAIFDGKTIDPDYDASSLALTLKAPVTVADLANDPRWAPSDWPPLMGEHGLASCWSMPILAGNQEVLGIFAVYRREPGSPTTGEKELVDRFTKIAGIAIERAQGDAALKASEAELRRAHAHFTVAQRLSATGSFVSDLVADEHTWSEELYRIFQFDPGIKISVQRVRDVVHPEDLQLYDAVVERGIAGHDVDFEFRIVTQRGAGKHLRAAASVSKHIEGRPVFMGAIQDVTKSKVAEEALKASEAELRRAYHSLTEAQRLSQTGSFTADVMADDHIWSEELYRIFEFDPGTKISVQAVRAALHPEDLPAFDAGFQRSAIEGTDFDQVFRIVTPNGNVKHLHSVAHVIERVEGRPVFIGAIQDVTKSKVAEDALKASEAELRQANAHFAVAQRLSATGSFVSDLQADDHAWSEELYRIYEWDPATPVSIRSFRDIIHLEDLQLFDVVVERAMAGDDVDFHFRVVTPRGTVKHLRGIARISKHIEGRPVFMGAIQDVTESKIAEEALNKAWVELAHMARVMTLGALTASIAHEVNQPLSGIITNASTCLRMLAADPPNLDGARATAQRTLRDGNRASEVVQRLRAMFAHKQPTTEPVDLNDAAREVLALSSSELQRSHVVLRTDFDESLPAVRGDRIQLQQVVLNLILNAADAMRTIDDRPRNLLVATTREDASRVRLSVSDSGVGIDPQNVEKLFDAFYTTKSHGMGVGLSISRSIIENHEGRLWASANDGPGATFSFSIPCRCETAPASEDAA